MNSLKATEQITRLKGRRHLFAALDAAGPHIEDEMTVATSSDLNTLVRLLGQTLI